MIIYGHVRCLGFSLMLDCVSVLDLELVAIVEWLMQYIAAIFHAHAWVVLRYTSEYLTIYEEIHLTKVASISA